MAGNYLVSFPHNNKNLEQIVKYIATKKWLFLHFRCFALFWCFEALLNFASRFFCCRQPSLMLCFSANQSRGGKLSIFMCLPRRIKIFLTFAGLEEKSYVLIHVSLLSLHGMKPNKIPIMIKVALQISNVVSYNTVCRKSLYFPQNASFVRAAFQKEVTLVVSRKDVFSENTDFVYITLAVRIFSW